VFTARYGLVAYIKRIYNSGGKYLQRGTDCYDRGGTCLQRGTD
jgi:hypothetical protein